MPMAMRRLPPGMEERFGMLMVASAPEGIEFSGCA